VYSIPGNNSLVVNKKPANNFITFSGKNTGDNYDIFFISFWYYLGGIFRHFTITNTNTGGSVPSSSANYLEGTFDSTTRYLTIKNTAQAYIVLIVFYIE
jgi:hypothetical protein